MGRITLLCVKYLERTLKLVILFRLNCGLAHKPRPHPRVSRRLPRRSRWCMLTLLLLNSSCWPLWGDLHAVKTQLVSDKAATDATISELKDTVGEMEHALTECSDDIVAMKTTIKSLTANVDKLENKCEDLESRLRRNNIRILGVPEGPDTCTTAAVVALLKEAFGLVKEPLLDWSHRTLQPISFPRWLRWYFMRH